MEMLINLDYDEIVLLRSINYYFENEHYFYQDQRRELLFDLVNQVLDKIITGVIPIDVDDYYSGNLENEMDHANLTQMRHLLRDAGAHLFKKMYNPGRAMAKERAARIEIEKEKDVMDLDWCRDETT